MADFPRETPLAVAGPLAAPMRIGKMRDHRSGESQRHRALILAAYRPARAPGLAPRFKGLAPLAAVASIGMFAVTLWMLTRIELDPTRAPSASPSREIVMPSRSTPVEEDAAPPAIPAAAGIFPPHAPAALADSPGGPYVIHIAAFQSVSRAQHLVDELTREGYRTYRISIDAGRGRQQLWQVIAGAYVSPELARADLDRLREHHRFGDAYLVRRSTLP